MGIRVYKLSIGYKYVIIPFLLFVTTAGIIWCPKTPNLYWYIPDLIVLIISWYLLFTMVHKIEFINEIHIVFSSLTKRIEICPLDVKEITDFGKIGLLIKTSKGNLVVTNLIDNFMDLKVRLSFLLHSNPGPDQ